jgi:hypothetical protein
LITSGDLALLQIERCQLNYCLNLLTLKNYINNRCAYTPVQSPLPRIISTESSGDRTANASTLNETTERAAINTDIRQIKVLLKQASSAIPKAVNDGDMTTEDATALGNLLEQSGYVANFSSSVSRISQEI